LKNNERKNGWGGWLNGRVPVKQVQGLEFKPQYCREKREREREREGGGRKGREREREEREHEQPREAGERVQIHFQSTELG
jgi:hypothetical protein